MLKKTLSIVTTRSALVAVAIFFLAGMVVWPQAQPPSMYEPKLISYNGTPPQSVGACTVDQIALNVSNGAFYSCNPSTRTWIGTQVAALPMSITQGGFTHTLTGSTTAPRTWTLQDTSDTFVYRGTTDILSNKSFSTQIISTVATGTAPFSIASTTNVPNLNASLLGGLSAPASAIVGISDTQTLTSKTLTSPALSNPTSQHYLGSGTAPTCSVTGAGTGATCDATTVSGAKDSAGVMAIHTGTSPSASGTVTLIYNGTYATNGFCTFMLTSSAGSWNARATIIGTTVGTASEQANWDNNAVSLTGSSQYLVLYVCGGS